MAVDNGDLPNFYRDWYCQWEVEHVQEETASWFGNSNVISQAYLYEPNSTPPSLDEAVHPDWLSTKDFAPTGEQFYLSMGPKTKEDITSNNDFDPIGDVATWRASMPPSVRACGSNQSLMITLPLY